MTPLLALLLALIAAPAVTSTTNWPQWGGPDRNFVVAQSRAGPDLAGGRPAPASGSGPLGDGYLSHRHRRPHALHALSGWQRPTSPSRSMRPPGKTVWESPLRCAVSTRPVPNASGRVPRAAPLITGDRLITISAGGMMTQLRSTDRTKSVERDLVAPDSRRVRACGYSSSPLAFERHDDHDRRRTGPRSLALDARRANRLAVRRTSRTATRRRCSSTSTGSPSRRVHLRRSRRPRSANRHARVEPVPHASDKGVNVATPVWGSDHLLFVSSAYNGGSRVLRLTRRQAAGSSRGSLGEPPRPRPLRQRRSLRQPNLRVERRLRCGAVRGHRRRTPATWCGAIAASRARR